MSMWGGILQQETKICLKLVYLWKIAPRKISFNASMAIKFSWLFVMVLWLYWWTILWVFCSAFMLSSTGLPRCARRVPTNSFALKLLSVSSWKLCGSSCFFFVWCFFIIYLKSHKVSVSLIFCAKWNSTHKSWKKGQFVLWVMANCNSFIWVSDSNLVIIKKKKIAI